MPGDRDIDVVERAGADHEPLGRPALLGGTAVIAHPPLHLIAGEPILHRRSGQQRGGAEQVVSASMAGAVALQRALLGHAGLLTEPRQRIVFAEDRDHRPAVAGFAHHRGRDAGQVRAYAETLALQHGDVLGTGAVLGIGELRHSPDAVAQRLEVRLSRIHQPPYLFRVAHVISRWTGVSSAENLTPAAGDGPARRPAQFGPRAKRLDKPRARAKGEACGTTA